MPIIWKDEDEIDGIAVGPTYEITDGGEIITDLGWLFKPKAMELARNMGTEFEEV